MVNDARDLNTYLTLRNGLHVQPMTPTCVSLKSQASRPEQSVMQALESLTETQVSITYGSNVVVDVFAILKGCGIISFFVSGISHKGRS